MRAPTTASGVVIGLAMALAAGAAASPAAAQVDRPGPPTIRVAGLAGGSLRQSVSEFRVAEDVLSFSVRVTVPRRWGLQPWVQAERFWRPELECPDGIPCNTEGWTGLVGVTLPLSGRPGMQSGVSPYALTGVGWAFSEDDRFAYVLGFGVAVPLSGRIAPTLELRWEDLPGIRNVVMLNLGLIVDFL